MRQLGNWLQFKDLPSTLWVAQSLQHRLLWTYRPSQLTKDQKKRQHLPHPLWIPSTGHSNLLQILRVLHWPRGLHLPIQPTAIRRVPQTRQHRKELLVGHQHPSSQRQHHPGHLGDRLRANLKIFSKEQWAEQWDWDNGPKGRRVHLLEQKRLWRLHL